LSSSATVDRDARQAHPLSTARRRRNAFPILAESVGLFSRAHARDAVFQSGPQDRA
jgi:hypothetical protein